MHMLQNAWMVNPSVLHIHVIDFQFWELGAGVVLSNCSLGQLFDVISKLLRHDWGTLDCNAKIEEARPHRPSKRISLVETTV